MSADPLPRRLRATRCRFDAVNPLTISAAHLARLRKICLALPEATEKVAWGDPTWRVRDKIFAMQKGNYDGGRPSLWLKAADGVQNVLVDSKPKRFFVPPYVGSKGWVGVYMDAGRIPWSLVGELIAESYRLIAPKRLASAARGASATRPSAKRPSAKRPGGKRPGAKPKKR